jgi:hypothetical protein
MVMWLVAIWDYSRPSIPVLETTSFALYPWVPAITLASLYLLYYNFTWLSFLSTLNKKGGSEKF